MTKYYFQDNLGFKFIAKICGNLFSLILLSLEFAIKILCINEMEMNITQSYNNKKYPNKFHCQGDLVLNNWFILRISCQYMLIFTIGGSKVFTHGDLNFSLNGGTVAGRHESMPQQHNQKCRNDLGNELWAAL